MQLSQFSHVLFKTIGPTEFTSTSGPHVHVDNAAAYLWDLSQTRRVLPPVRTTAFCQGNIAARCIETQRVARMFSAISSRVRCIQPSGLSICIRLVSSARRAQRPRNFYEASGRKPIRPGKYGCDFYRSVTSIEYHVHSLYQNIFHDQAMQYLVNHRMLRPFQFMY